jgi:hypothetical protein
MNKRNEIILGGAIFIVGMVGITIIGFVIKILTGL